MEHKWEWEVCNNGDLIWGERADIPDGKRKVWHFLQVNIDHYDFVFFDHWIKRKWLETKEYDNEVRFMDGTIEQRNIDNFRSFCRACLLAKKYLIEKREQEDREEELQYIADMQRLNNEIAALQKEIEIIEREQKGSVEHEEV